MNRLQRDTLFSQIDFNIHHITLNCVPTCGVYAAREIFIVNEDEIPIVSPASSSGEGFIPKKGASGSHQIQRVVIDLGVEEARAQDQQFTVPEEEASSTSAAIIL